MTGIEPAYSAWEVDSTLVLLVSLWKFAGWLDRRLEARENKRTRARDAVAAIVARADQQHAWVLAGDDRGIYGDYTPKQID